MKPYFKYGLIAFCFFSVFVTIQASAQIAKSLIIETDKIYDPDVLSLDSLEVYEKSFNYDWNNYASITTNQRKLYEIEDFIHNTPPEEFTKLQEPAKEALGKMFYKLGTYYTHVEYQPDKAITYLSSANNFLSKHEDKAWTYNNLAYAYEKKYLVTADETDQKQGFYFIKQAMQLCHNKTCKEIAFSYCMQGLFENDAGNYKQAEDHYKTALAIYEKTPNGKDEQYHRARTRLAAIKLANDDNDDALEILKEQKKYWQHQGPVSNNPYAARNLLILGQTYLKLGRPEEAKKEITQATAIYEYVYGKENAMLSEPYQILADTYKILDKKSLADNYQILANSLDDS